MTQQPPIDYASAPAPDGKIIAKAYWWYLMSRYVLAVVVFGFGIRSIQDGFYRYPQENQNAINQHLEKLPHPGLDVQFNKVFGVALPPLGIALAIWCWYNSRGRIELEGNLLRVPGHPEISLADIREIDRAKWDRKGIAYLNYQVAGTTMQGTIKLDDFVYDRPPIDKIFDAAVAAVAGDA